MTDLCSSVEHTFIYSHFRLPQNFLYEINLFFYINQFKKMQSLYLWKKILENKNYLFIFFLLF